MQKKSKNRLTKMQLDAGERAAIKAGYSPRTARRTAAKLLRNPKVIAEIERGMKEMGITPDENEAAD